MSFRLPLLLPLIAAVAIAADPSAPGDRSIENTWRLYDLTPVSEANPVLASVKECGIEIPLSELRGFVRSDTPPTKIGQTLTAEEKRQELQKLLNDYFWIWSGYRQQVDENDPQIRSMLRITRDESMRTLLIKREVEDKAKSMAEYQLLRRAFVRQLFDRTEIHVSAPAFELAKAAAKRLNAADAGGQRRNEDNPLPDGLTQAERLQPLATAKIGTLRLGDFLAVYTQPPVAERVNLDQPEAAAQVLAEAYSGALLLAEAEARGLDRDPAVRQQIQSDRTGLVRQWAMEEVAKRADAVTHDPATEPQLKAWYQAHVATLYTKKDDQGRTHVLPYAPNSDQILSDYFVDLLGRMRREELQRLRQGKTIAINEPALDAAVVRWLEAPPRVEMPATKITWDTDHQEYAAKPGEAATSFVFHLQNVSGDLLTLDDVHPIVEFVTVDGPPFPWRLAPGQQVALKLEVDLRSKRGVGTYPIEVLSSVGMKTLTLKVTYPPANPAAGAAAQKPAQTD